MAFYDVFNFILIVFKKIFSREFSKTIFVMFQKSIEIAFFCLCIFTLLYVLLTNMAWPMGCPFVSRCPKFTTTKGFPHVVVLIIIMKQDVAFESLLSMTSKRSKLTLFKFTLKQVQSCKQSTQKNHLVFTILCL